jgi:hypothetical protein
VSPAAIRKRPSVGRLERVDVQENALQVRIRAERLARLVGELQAQGERMAA